MNAYGQAALEYLATYGWVLIIIVLSAMALFILGILNPATYQGDTCTGFSPLAYLGHAIDSDTFSLILANGSGGRVVVNNAYISFDDWDTNYSYSGPLNIAPSQQKQIDISITPPLGAYSSNVLIDYTKNGLSKRERGACTGTTNFSSASFSVNSGATFNEGIYFQTNFNTDHVELNGGQTSGNYQSKIFDAGKNANWNKISWTQGLCYQCELPDNSTNETGDYISLANMASNKVLLHLNESTGNVFDTSGNNNNCTPANFEGDEYGASGKFNKALSFDGTDDILVGPSSNAITGNNLQTITMSAWVKTTSNAAMYVASIKRAPAASTSTLFSLTAGNSGRGNLGFLTRNAANTAHVYLNHNGGYNDGTWHYLAGVINGATRTLYIDGVAVATDNAGMQSVSGNTAPFTVGGFKNGYGSLHFDGLIDEVSIWDRALSSTEILNRYKRGALNLNLDVRSCDDAACVGESYTSVSGQSSQLLSLPSNRYFQFKHTFVTTNTAYTPELHNVKVNYIA